MCNKNTNEIQCGQPADEYLASMGHELIKQTPVVPPGVIDCTENGRKKWDIEGFYSDADDEVEIILDYEFDYGLSFISLMVS